LLGCFVFELFDIVSELLVMLCEVGYLLNFI